jgi:hypothetical protein
MGEVDIFVLLGLRDLLVIALDISISDNIEGNYAAY